ncbi:sigma 54-interacting transcriptional regulator [Desulfosporosinus nitroreducens]|uniref:Sigma 54-interacting transcriptional regulator n=1 Tax=Desulfosporosinus nitroreducens TaxID=2018668 RepID=A0ABT8QTV0_9FIRM|nr:sigma-54-dependent Fis family transcriptional regulator [Desulfosporosinus nitroreducens]MCO1603714.1 sigma 54-interacting transcriptional regulator [Desulfosporosinus nitroreducens]MDO0824267.1 sigma 54-interacting transcriptional regulator [Desulfosporosinus nitroreducens]
MGVFSDMIIGSGIDTMDCMITLDFPKVSQDRNIYEVYEEFGQSLDCVYVLNRDGLLVGLLDQAAMLQAGARKNMQKLAGELVCKVPMCLPSSSSVQEAITLFLKLKVNEVPVTDETRRMIGVLKLWPLFDYQASKLERLEQELNKSKKLTATLEAVIENPYEGMVVVDENSHVTMINNFYLEVLGVTREQALGRHICELTPHSELPNIVRTGKAQFVDYWKVGDRDFMIIRAPIKKDGKTIGALGKTLFKDMGLAHVFARKLAQLENDLKFYKEELRKIHSATYTFDDIIGEGFKITATIRLAQRAARTTSTVLLTGESGTGKELFAHAIHNYSVRRHGPFIKVNCAAIPEQLLESELFGYVEGAFTGASKDGKPGKFELANHGTIFLDEIGDMSLTMQAKLLRVIQEREIERIGGTQPFKIDVRIITATNRKLEKMLQEGTFREDLFYRLNVMVLELPCLRERSGDIRLLANYMVTKLNQKLETDVEGISQEAMQILQNYAWPGNVRELESVLERTMNMVDEPIILPEHLPARILQAKMSVNDPQSGEHSRFEEGRNFAEKELLVDALRRAKGNKAQAAKILGIHRSVLYKKLTKHGLGGEVLSGEL